ncbi:hypothetical protein GL50803_0094150 [Giardia duodenalis]|uniref:Uncharacterized protein n=1 Tax=Giardia intestinalis (strain ATCC 50803 / WB clone C6) TaxID=184922 RepID=D3KHG4_GIAIC|nr:hypothetical protein GL50803_0094150 [Giardia intestinalis]KAE8301465.1 hypothetical protein GL50803_0094150 [Giardia intestinalis]
MPFGLDQLCDTQAQPRSRVLPLGTGSTRSEDPSSYRALRVRNSPFLTNVPLVSKATPQFAHKSIVHGDVLGSHVASAILCHVPSAEGRSKQSALPPHENSLINQVLPRISDTLHEMARNATPDFSQYSVLKGSEDVDDSPLASVDLDKYTKNPHSVPHSRVLRRACPPGSAIPGPKSHRKSSDSASAHPKASVHDPPGPVDRQFKSANAFLETGRASEHFSITDEDLDDTEIYQDIASSLPNSRGSNASRAKPVLSVEASPIHKRPMRKLCLNHFPQLVLHNDSRGRAPSVEDASNTSVSPAGSLADSNGKASPKVETPVCQLIQLPPITVFEDTCDEYQGTASKQSHTSSGKLSSCSPAGQLNSPRLRLSTGQTIGDISIDNSIQFPLLENGRLSGDRCSSIDMDLPIHLGTTLLTINESDNAEFAQQVADTATTNPALTAAYSSSCSVPHISSITGALNDSITEPPLMNSAEHTHTRLAEQRQYSIERFPVIDSTQLSGASFAHNSIANDDPDTGTFTSSKQSVIHLLKGSTRQLSDYRALIDPDQSTSLLTDNIDECMDSYVFIGKLGDEDGSADTKSCTLTPRYLNITSYCVGEDTSSTAIVDTNTALSHPRPSSEEILSGLSSDDWQRQIDAITKCISFFSALSTTTDNIEIQTIIASYVTVLSSPRSKVIKHAIETLVPIFLTKHPALLHYADRIFTPLLLRVGSASQADFISTAGDRALHVIVSLTQPLKLVPHLQKESRHKSPGVRLRVAQLFTIIFKEFAEDSQVVSHFRSSTEIYVETLLRLIGDSSESARKYAREAFAMLLSITRIPGESVADFLTRCRLCTVDNLSRVKFVE